MPPTSLGSYGLGLFSPAGCKAEAEMKRRNTFKSAPHLRSYAFSGYLSIKVRVCF